MSRWIRGGAFFIVAATTGIAGGYCAGAATDISQKHPHSAANEGALIAAAVFLIVLSCVLLAEWFSEWTGP